MNIIKRMVTTNGDVLSKKGEAKEHTGIRLTKEQLEWLRRKVREGEFASVSHGIRRCIQRAMEPVFVAEPWMEYELTCGHRIRTEFTRFKEGDDSYCSKCGKDVKIKRRLK